MLPQSTANGQMSIVNGARSSVSRDLGSHSGLIKIAIRLAVPRILVLSSRRSRVRLPSGAFLVVPAGPFRRAPEQPRLRHNRAMAWELGPGVLELPDGARLRGRGLREASRPQPDPEWGLYLLGKPPMDIPWPNRWLRWPDFWLPRDAQDARSAFAESHRLAREGCRVEVACGGGKGRTGTALACIAQLGGVPADDAVTWVRAHYRPGAVETPWQRRYVRRISAGS